MCSPANVSCCLPFRARSPDLPSQASPKLHRQRGRLQKKQGVERVVCIAVNDPFVLAAWEEKSGGKEKVLFLSDCNAEFTKKIGMDFDGSGFGLGTRSKRYSALVEDGVVKILNVEASPGIAEASTASKILKSL
jgi:glutaredoxin/glutathione-dependent peroxiredoxin